jgi:hypothetical protein
MKINRYLPFAYLYFFVNSLALPFGLTYTALLAPFFYVWILLTRKKEILHPFIACLLPFIIIHFSVVGVDAGSYFRSAINLLLVYIFCQAVYTFFRQCTDPEKVFRYLLLTNFILCVIAIPVYFTPYHDWLWMATGLSTGLEEFQRLKLFTYEPSYYALLFTPIFLFFLLQYLLKQNSIPAHRLLPMLFLPFILSFSIGVLGSIFISLLFTWICWFGRLSKKRRVFNTIITAGSISITAIFFLLLFFRNNAVFLRLTNIYEGEDTSGKGRTFDAFILASRILEKGNEYWGVGLGQVKIAGETIVRDYYLYYMDFTVAIPNAVAETLAIFGWVGIALRFMTEIFLFFYTRVWTNYYRLSLFFFVFIYQFTGSFITNIAEYVIWILAFTNVFAQFNVRRDQRSEVGSRRSEVGGLK